MHEAQEPVIGLRERDVGQRHGRERAAIAEAWPHHDVADNTDDFALGAGKVVAVEPRDAKRKPAARVVRLQAHVLLEIGHGLGRLVPMQADCPHHVVHGRILRVERYRFLHRLVRFGDEVELHAHDAEQEMHGGVLRVDRPCASEIPECPAVVSGFGGGSPKV